MIDLDSLPGHFSVSDLSAHEALPILDRIEARAQSTEEWVRMRASDLLLRATTHLEPTVASKALDIGEWLVKAELVPTNEEPPTPLREVENDSPEAVIHLERDGEVKSFALPDEPIRIKPMANLTVLRNINREFALGAVHPDYEIALRSVSLLGILALEGSESSKARRGLGYAGKFAPHLDVAKVALGVLKGCGENLNLMTNEDTIFDILMAVKAISERIEPEIQNQAQNVFGTVAAQSLAAIYPKAIADAKRSVLYGYESYTCI